MLKGENETKKITKLFFTIRMRVASHQALFVNYLLTLFVQSKLWNMELLN